MNSTIVGLEIKIPNYWSVNLSEKESFNIMPFIGIMLLIHKLNKNSVCFWSKMGAFKFPSL